MYGLLTFILLAASLASDAHTVSQQDRSFQPAEITLGAGQTVRIENDDRFVHHVLAKGPGLSVDSGAQRPGEWLEIEFARQGIYDISCDIHPKMALKVTVE